MAADPLPPRTRSARLTLISLLLIPLLSLAVLWGLIASITFGNVIRYQHYNTVIATISPSVTGLEQTLPVERAITLVWLGGGRQSPVMQAQLAATRRSTDKYVPAVRSAVMSVRGLLNAKAIAQENVFLADLAGLDRIRAAVDSGADDTVTAFNAYSTISKAEYEFFQIASPPSDPDRSGLITGRSGGLAAPLPILGPLAEILFLRRYMLMLLRERNTVIQQIAESSDWQRYLPAPTTVTR